MKAFPNYRYNTVHIESLYQAEKSLFGIHTGGGVLTPNEYWRVPQDCFFYILVGGFFLSWGPLPLGFFGFPFFRKKKKFFSFFFRFLAFKIVGFVFFYLFPA